MNKRVSLSSWFKIVQGFSRKSYRRVLYISVFFLVALEPPTTAQNEASTLTKKPIDQILSLGLKELDSLLSHQYHDSIDERLTANSLLQNHLIDLQSRLRNPIKQEKLLLRQLHDAQRQGSDSLAFKSQCQLIMVFADQRKFKQADSLITLVMNNVLYKGDWRSKHAIAHFYKIKKDPVKSATYFDMAIAISENKSLLAETYSMKESQAELYMIELAIDTSFTILNDILAYHRKHNLGVSNYLAYKLLGEYYSFKRDYVEAITHYREALAIADKYGDYHGYAQVLLRLGAMYQLISDIDLALEHYTRALNYAERHQAKMAQGIAYYYMAGLYMYEKKDYYKAGKLSDNAHQIFNEYGASDFNLLSHVLWATSFVRQGDYQRALSILDEIKIDPETSLKYGQIMYYLVSGQTLIESNHNIPVGVSQSKKALEIINESNISDGTIIQAYDNLCEGYKKLGMPDQALPYKEKAFEEQKIIYSGDRIRETLKSYYSYQVKSKATIDSLKISAIEQENTYLYELTQSRKKLLFFLSGFAGILCILLFFLYRTRNKLRISRAELKNSFEELDVITNSVPIGICKIDADLNVLWLNEQMRKFPQLEYVSTTFNCCDVLPPTSVDLIRKRLKDNVVREPVSFESALLPDLSVSETFEKGMLWAKVIYVPLKHDKSGSQHYIVLQDDHTTEKLRELELKNINTELESEYKTNMELLSNSLQAAERAIKIIKEDRNIQSRTKLKLMKVLDQRANKHLIEDIDHKFVKLNEAFYKKMSTKYPNMTPNNLKLCTYLKMNLSTKDIAVLQFTSPESVKVARSRLRKKLKIKDPSTTLNSFLNSI